MVNWGALIEAPIGVMLLYVGIVMIQPIQDPLFGELSNTIAFPYGGTITILVQLVSLIMGVMLLFLAYRSFREPEAQQYFQG